MTDNRRIVYNTIILYIKLIISVVVNFLMARVVLEAIGVDDYGLYSVVGGVVTFLNVLGTSMVATSYRFITVEIGKEEKGSPRKIYNTILVIHVALALFLLIIGESVGVYYVENFLNASVDKIPDAEWVLHISLMSTAITVLCIPANGLIIAKEKFLYTSTVDIVFSLLKLYLAIQLCEYSGNRLIGYAVIMAIYAIALPLCSQLYCFINYREIIKWSFNKHKDDYRCVIKFAWWIMLGAFALISVVQLSAVVINYFWGTIVNAAYSLATQVSNATSMFTQTLRQATIPQIMKNQSAGKEERSLFLVYKTSKYSFLIMLVLAAPLFFFTDVILNLWLNSPPAYTSIMVRFLLVAGLVSNLGSGFDASIQATGKVKLNQIGYCIINLSLIPLLCLFYKMGFPPYLNVILMLAIATVLLLFQLYVMLKVTGLCIKDYFHFTLVPAFKSTLFIIAAFLIMYTFIDFNDILLWKFILLFLISIAISLAGVILGGMSKEESKTILGLVLSNRR